MAITYPLSLPTHTGIRSIELRAINAVAYSMSPFTFAGQSHSYSGQMWQADVTLPPMKIADAEQWLGFLLSLNGQAGTFLLGDPLRTTTQNAGVGLSISTPSIGDKTLTGTVTGGTLKAGDYIQLGTGVDSSLHKVLQDVTVGAGKSIEIWPGARSTSTTVTLNSAKGLFRLSTNEQAWSINEASIYGITFAAREAINV
jgi:hypothetical protein